MFGLRTSRFCENSNNNKIALNLFQGDINDFDENEEYEDILTKRGKVKNRAKIEYFKNYINNFKEIKFKTARQVEIFRKKENKKQNRLKEKTDNNINMKENIQKNKVNFNDKFNLIKETFEESRQNQLDVINNNINNQRNNVEDKNPQKSKKTIKEISNKILQNNEEIMNKLKKNKNMTKIVEKEKLKIKNKIMKLKEKDKRKNLSTEKAFELLDKDNEKFLKLIKAKKMRKMVKKQLNKSFNNSYNKEKYFNNENQIQASLTKTVSNEIAERRIKIIRNKFHMKIISSKNIFFNSMIEKEIFNKKCKNKTKVSKYLSKSCANKKDKSKNTLDNNGKEIEKINQKQYIKKKENKPEYK